MKIERYRIKLINADTKESCLTLISFSSREAAENWAGHWRAQGAQMECEIIDTKKPV